MAIEKYEVRNRWTNAVQFTAEIECAPDAPLCIKLGLAVRWARKRSADLRSAYLRSADLRSADLRGADLRGADLSRAVLSDAVLSDAVLSSADLSSAYLRGADLRGADLSRAVLSSADLSSAYLRGADLRSAYLSRAVLSDAVLSDAVLSDADLSSADLSRADLSSADLSRADLSSADLSRADLSRADLRGAYLRSFKADVWMTLLQAKPEVPALIRALRDGRVDGSQYEGDCACLVGTIANTRGVSYKLAFPDADSRNPAEQWFLMIRKGDKPGDDTAGGFAATKALEWALEFCEWAGVDPEPAAQAEAA